VPTHPTWSIRNLALSRGDQYEDSTGGTVTTTETIIATVVPFFGNLADRVRLTAAVLGKIQVTVFGKGGAGGVSIEFRLRKDNAAGTIIDTKTLAISHSTVTPLLDLPAVLIALDAPALEAADKTYVLTAKKVVGTSITATAEWDEAKLQATVLSA
jgi:hypothetical protein